MELIEAESNMSTAERDRVGARLLWLALTELFTFRFMQTDPNWSNFLYAPRTHQLSLIDFGACQSYDPNQGANFQTYASIRIRGAILDELRRNDWLPRSVQTQLGEVSRAIAKVEAREGRTAQDHEVAEAMQLPLDEYRENIELTSLGDKKLDSRRGRVAGAEKKILTLG